jgi:ribosomal protein L37AE/L43A
MGDDIEARPNSEERKIPQEQCPVCGEPQYWRAATGPWRCATCDPWENLEHVEQWWYVTP